MIARRWLTASGPTVEFESAANTHALVRKGSPMRATELPSQPKNRRLTTHVVRRDTNESRTLVIVVDPRVVAEEGCGHALWRDGDFDDADFNAVSYECHIRLVFVERNQ